MCLAGTCHHNESLRVPSLLVALGVLAVAVVPVRVIVDSKGSHGLASTHGPEASAWGLVRIEIRAHYHEF